MKQIIASLDIGSSNIKLIVGEIHRGKLFVLACSKVESKGIKKGIIVNEEEAYSSIKEAFKKAQGILGIKLTRVVLVVPSYFASFVKSEGYTTIDREDNFVNGDDITKALQASVFNRVSPNLELVSVTPKEFIINETSSVKDPKGMEAHRLSVNSLLGLIPKKNIYLTIDLLEKNRPVSLRKTVFPFIVFKSHHTPATKMQMNTAGMTQYCFNTCPAFKSTAAGPVI